MQPIFLLVQTGGCYIQMDKFSSVWVEFLLSTSVELDLKYIFH